MLKIWPQPAMCSRTLKARLWHATGSLQGSYTFVLPTDLRAVSTFSDLRNYCMTHTQRVLKGTEIDIAYY